MALYEIAVMGDPTDDQITALHAEISKLVAPFGMTLGAEIGWHQRPQSFIAGSRASSSVAFFGVAGEASEGLGDLMHRGVPVIPVARAAGSIGADLPAELKSFNALTWQTDGVLRIATALLECIGLLPRQRRVFVSYKRSEAREAALQLFNFLSEKVFDVFLDTHGILPAEDFQATLWHRLCDSDVILMLDTPSYFDSRWTSAEFGRALSKGISILRVAWPGVVGTRRTATTSLLALDTTDVEASSGRLTKDALERILAHVEQVRAQSHAVRRTNMISGLKVAVESVGGTVTGVGTHNAVSLTLANGRAVVAYPTLGVPTSVTLNDAVDRAAGVDAAILYDHIGLKDQWLKHLRWLGEEISAVKWVRTAEAAWEFGGWEAK